MAMNPRSGLPSAMAVVLATHGPDANATHGENSGLDRSLAHEFDGFGHIDARIEIGRIFKREMRHGGFLPKAS
jgi:hypothetical protein